MSDSRDPASTQPRAGSDAPDAPTRRAHARPSGEGSGSSVASPGVAGPARAVELDLGRLFDRHQRQLLGLALRITGDFALAEDALQETFLQALAASRSSSAAFRGDAAPGTWLYRIAARVAVRLRSNSARRRSLESDALLATQAGPSERDETHGSDAWFERTRRLLAALDRIPEDQRLALTLLSVREIPAEEVAQMLGTTPGTVYTRAFRARRRLHELLLD